jgi:hypothetical protein
VKNPEYCGMLELVKKQQSRLLENPDKDPAGCLAP